MNEMLFYIALLSLGLIGIYKFREGMLIIQRRKDLKKQLENSKTNDLRERS